MLSNSGSRASSRDVSAASSAGSGVLAKVRESLTSINIFGCSGFDGPRGGLSQPRLLRGPAAIDGDRCSRDLVRRRRTQKGDGASELLRRGKIERRLFLGQQLLDGLLLTDTAFGSDVADLLFDQRRS